MLTHQHVHPLTPYPQTSEASSSGFPFTTVLPSRSSTWPSSSTSTSTTSFRYPQPHARSYPSASFALSLQGIKDTPIPPSLLLLERRRSSTSSTFSSTSTTTVDSGAMSEASSSWGNWTMESPVPGLSRCASENSVRGGKVELKTPETTVFTDFEEQQDAGFSHARAGSFELDLDAPMVGKSMMRTTRPRLFNTPPRVVLPVSSSPIKTTTTTMTNERPKLERKGTPLVLPLMRPSGLFTAKTSMTPISTTSTTTTTPTTQSSATPVTRPKLTRKLTPHPEFDLTLAIPHSGRASTGRKDPSLSSSIVEEESEEDSEDEETISIPYLPVRGRPLERKTRTPLVVEWNEAPRGGMRRFSSVIEEGKVWLAV